MLGGVVSAEPCPETITIDSVVHVISDQWCGSSIDSSQIAEPATLVSLPQELTFEEYRIYVLPETKAAFGRLADAARKAGLELIADSGFRSKSFQARIIRRRLLAGDTFEEILKFVAPPGYSEHHTGRALDLCPSEARFAHSATYRWLSEHAGEFGFVESYSEDSASVMPWESWHWYYVESFSPVKAAKSGR